MAAVVGVGRANHFRLVKLLWKYIKKHDLQNPANKNEIACDAALKAAFKKDKVTSFGMSKLLSAHMHREHDSFLARAPVVDYANSKPPATKSDAEDVAGAVEDTPRTRRAFSELADYLAAKGLSRGVVTNWSVHDEPARRRDLPRPRRPHLPLQGRGRALRQGRGRRRGPRGGRPPRRGGPAAARRRGGAARADAEGLLFEGDAIEARCRGGAWYPGRVAFVHDGGGAIDVAYDDGDAEARACAGVRAPASPGARGGAVGLAGASAAALAPGAKVEIYWDGDDAFYAGTVARGGGRLLAVDRGAGRAAAAAAASRAPGRAAARGAARPRPLLVAAEAELHGGTAEEEQAAPRFCVPQFLGSKDVAGARAASVQFFDQAWASTRGRAVPARRLRGWSVVLTGSASQPTGFVDGAGVVYWRRKDAARAMGILDGPLSERATSHFSKYATTPSALSALLLESGTPAAPPAAAAAVAPHPLLVAAEAELHGGTAEEEQARAAGYAPLSARRTSRSARASVKYFDQAWGSTHDGEPCPPARYAGWSVVLTGVASEPTKFVDGAGFVYRTKSDAARAMGALAGRPSESSMPSPSPPQRAASPPLASHPLDAIALAAQRFGLSLPAPAARALPRRPARRPPRRAGPAAPCVVAAEQLAAAVARAERAEAQVAERDETIRGLRDTIHGHERTIRERATRAAPRWASSPAPRRSSLRKVDQKWAETPYGDRRALLFEPGGVSSPAAPASPTPAGALPPPRGARRRPKLARTEEDRRRSLEVADGRSPPLRRGGPPAPPAPPPDVADEEAPAAPPSAGRQRQRRPAARAKPNRVAFTCTDGDPVLESRHGRAQHVSSGGLVVAESATEADVLVTGPGSR
ncbi:upstream activation factor subunit [Aureococcus anophagefferens]|uniref:Upstream activation factor subunit n=1 Tax=Aureococcus anophagefferens TaxID=44056 RepID=A0ABR1FKW9_AURAN